MKSFLKNKPILFSAGAVLLFVIIIFIFSNNGNDVETLEVKRDLFIRKIAVAGKVIPREEVELGFESTGRVSVVYKDVGDKVLAAETISSIDTSSEYADLLKAEADLALELSESNNENLNYDKVLFEQNSLVENAYRKMLSEGLEAIPNSRDESATPPIITGAYTGSEGTYKIVINRKNISLDKYELLTFNLDKSGPIEIEENEPTALGTKGLFISFPDEVSEYEDTVWYISIPNTSSDEYLSNYNEYKLVLSTRDRELAEAKAKINNSSGVSISQAGIDSARGEIQRIKSEISKKILRAPFSGVITKQDAKVGSIVNANTPVTTLISDKEYQVETFVPEINIKDVKVGNTAKVTLDAYGEEVIFDTKVISIDPAETLRDGVSSYKVLFEFLAIDERIRSGMTANVDITTETKEDSILIPQSAIIKKDGFSFVKVKVGKVYVDKQVTTGGVSAKGDIEVISGLSEGEIVVVLPDKLEK